MEVRRDLHQVAIKRTVIGPEALEIASSAEHPAFTCQEYGANILITGQFKGGFQQVSGHPEIDGVRRFGSIERQPADTINHVHDHA